MPSFDQVGPPAIREGTAASYSKFLPISSLTARKPLYPCHCPHLVPLRLHFGPAIFLALSRLPQHEDPHTPPRRDEVVQIRDKHAHCIAEAIITPERTVTYTSIFAEK